MQASRLEGQRQRHVLVRRRDRPVRDVRRAVKRRRRYRDSCGKQGRLTCQCLEQVKRKGRAAPVTDNMMAIM